MASTHASVGRQVVSPGHTKHPSPLLSQMRTTSNAADNTANGAVNLAEHPSDCSVDQQTKKGYGSGGATHK